MLRLNLVNAGVARCPLRVPFRRTPPGSTDELGIEPTSSPTYCFPKTWPNLPYCVARDLLNTWIASGVRCSRTLQSFLAK